MGFINAELETLGRSPISSERAIDTVALARKKFPGAPASLDALCRRYRIDNSNRTLHGALLDAELLAEVYLELKGGRQRGLGLTKESETDFSRKTIETASSPPDQRIREPRPHVPTEEEQAAHKDFLEGLDNPIWLQS